MKTKTHRKRIFLLLLSLIVAVVIIFTIPTVRARIIQVKTRISLAASLFLENRYQYPKSFYQENSSAATIPVLLYHGISDIADKYTITQDLFRKHMIALYESGYRAITVEEFNDFMLNKKQLPNKSFLLTFDDGRKDSFYGADPILKQLGFSAVMFTATGQSLTDNALFSKYYLDIFELKQMQDSHRWSIQSHAVQDEGGFIPISNKQEGYFLSNKKWLDKEGRLETDYEYKERVDYQLSEPKLVIEKIFKNNVSMFSYPFSDYGQESTNNKIIAQNVIRENIKKNYSFAFRQQQGYDRGFVGNHPADDKLMLRRIEPASDWSASKLVRTLLSGDQIDQILDDKPLPLSNFSDRWKTVWGQDLNIKNNRIEQKVNFDKKSSFVILDGSRAWNAYKFNVDTTILDNDGAFSLYAGVQKPGTALRCVWDKNFIKVEQIENNKIIKDSKFRSKNDYKKRTYSIILKDGLVGCEENGELLAALQINSVSAGGIGFELWTKEKDISLSLSNLSVYFNEFPDKKYFIEKARHPLGSLVQDESITSLLSKLKNVSSPIRRFLNEEREYSQLGLFYWGDAIRSYTINKISSTYELSINEHQSGASYWRWRDIEVSNSSEYEISGTYTSTVPTEILIQGVKENKETQWVVVAELPETKEKQKYSFVFSVPADFKVFTAYHVIRGNGSLNIYNPSLSPLKNGAFDSSYITFSFDDGYQSFYDYVMPLFEKNNINASVPVVTGYTAYSRYMSPSDLSEISQKGFNIVAHSRSHAHLEDITRDEKITEIVGSRDDLLKAGFNSDVFVFPYGSFSSDISQIVKDAGFKGARTTYRGFNTLNTDPFWLKDYLVQKNTHISSIEAYIDQSIKDKTWIILELHDIYPDENFDNPEGISIKTLQEIVSLVREKQIKVVTLSEGLKKMGY